MIRDIINKLRLNEYVSDSDIEILISELGMHGIYHLISKKQSPYTLIEFRGEKDKQLFSKNIKGNPDDTIQEAIELRNNEARKLIRSRQWIPLKFHCKRKDEECSKDCIVIPRKPPIHNSRNNKSGFRGISYRSLDKGGFWFVTTPRIGDLKKPMTTFYVTKNLSSYEAFSKCLKIRHDAEMLLYNETTIDLSKSREYFNTAAENYGFIPGEDMLEKKNLRVWYKYCDRMRLIHELKIAPMIKLAELSKTSVSAISQWVERRVNKNLVEWCDVNGIQQNDDYHLLKLKATGKAYLKLSLHAIQLFNLNINREGMTMSNQSLVSSLKEGDKIPRQIRKSTGSIVKKWVYEKSEDGSSYIFRATMIPSISKKFPVADFESDTGKFCFSKIKPPKNWIYFEVIRNTGKSLHVKPVVGTKSELIEIYNDYEILPNGPDVVVHSTESKQEPDISKPPTNVFKSAFISSDQRMKLIVDYEPVSTLDISKIDHVSIHSINQWAENKVRQGYLEWCKCDGTTYPSKSSMKNDKGSGKMCLKIGTVPWFEGQVMKNLVIQNQIDIKTEITEPSNNDQVDTESITPVVPPEIKIIVKTESDDFDTECLFTITISGKSKNPDKIFKHFFPDSTTAILQDDENGYCITITQFEYRPVDLETRYKEIVDPLIAKRNELYKLTRIFEIREY